MATKKSGKRNEKQSWKIIVDLEGTELRRKSDSTLPPFFREWPSVEKEIVYYQKKWAKIRRRVNTVSNPPFNIYSEWLMDFATISAYQSERIDWENFRRMILIHVPHCPLDCAYCFIDANKEKVAAKGDLIPIDGSKTQRKLSANLIIQEFRKYKEQNEREDGAQVNTLRISGGEPFTEPDLVFEIAEAFANEEGFLWVDTNLVLLTDAKGRYRPHIAKAVKALEALGKRVAIHACMHGVDTKSFLRNSYSKIDQENAFAGLRRLVESGLAIYPRFNPVGLMPEEVEGLFQRFYEIDPKLPAMTYAGIIEYFYEATIDHVLEIQGKSTVFSKKSSSKPRNDKVSFNPTNIAINVWDEMMFRTYGFGYGIVPRHLVNDEMVRHSSLTVSSDSVKSDKEKEQNGSMNYDWQDIILIALGWQKDEYAKKMLKVIASPDNTVLDKIYENKWVEPNMVFQIYSSPESFVGKRVLFIAAVNDYGIVKIAPVRWGELVSAQALIDETPKKKKREHEKMPLTLRVKLLEYAYDLPERIGMKKGETLEERISSFIGHENLPGASMNGHYCQYVGLKFKKNWNDNPRKKSVSAFQSTILALEKLETLQNQRDVYFRFESMTISSRREGELDKQVLFNEEVERYVVNEEDVVKITLDCYNPNLDNTNYPTTEDTLVEVSTTTPEHVNIAPILFRLSKYSKREVFITFKRKGEFDTKIRIRSKSKNALIADVDIPFQVVIEGGE